MSLAAIDDVQVPSLRDLLREVRFVGEACRYLLRAERRLLKTATQGDLRPILVLPGFLCNDTATWALRRYLRNIGYRVYSWRQGINWGQHPDSREALVERLKTVHARCGAKVTIIGWSLGGVYARELASLHPELVEEVITLGTPWHGSPQSTAVWRAYALINRKTLASNGDVNVEFESETVPCTSIYTKGDGIVPWQMSIPKAAVRYKSHEVCGSHIGLVANAEVMQILTEHLQSSRPGARQCIRRTPIRRGIVKGIKSTGGNAARAAVLQNLGSRSTQSGQKR